MARSIRMLQLDFAMLCVFKVLKEDKVIRYLGDVLDGITHPQVGLIEAIERYNKFVYALAKHQVSLSLKAYIQEKVVYSEHLLALMIEKNTHLHERILEQTKLELTSLEQLSDLEARTIKEGLCLKGQDKVEQMMLIERLMEWENTLTVEENHVLGMANWSEKVVDLLCFYKDYGCGTFAKFKTFSVGEQGELQGIPMHDAIGFEQLIGYDTQKEDLLMNTRRLGQGKSANNVLLYGARGTGKSTMVKALMTHREVGRKVRLVEVRKDQLMCLKKLFSLLASKPYQFIVFIDDLAFEERNETYTMLKTMLEGGVEAKPNNVVIYATSNRRHLVKEHEVTNERHGREAVEECMSLSDRFGLRIYFQSPSQIEYLSIVKGLAQEKGIKLAANELERLALQWEMWNNGKSGRTARQFIEQL